MRSIASSDPTINFASENQLSPAIIHPLHQRPSGVWTVNASNPRLGSDLTLGSCSASPKSQIHKHNLNETQTAIVDVKKDSETATEAATSHGNSTKTAPREDHSRVSGVVSSGFVRQKAAYFELSSSPAETTSQKKVSTLKIGPAVTPSSPTSTRVRDLVARNRAATTQAPSLTTALGGGLHTFDPTTQTAALKKVESCPREAPPSLLSHQVRKFSKAAPPKGLFLKDKASESITDPSFANGKRQEDSTFTETAESSTEVVKEVVAGTEVDPGVNRGKTVAEIVSEGLRGAMWSESDSE